MTQSRARDAVFQPTVHEAMQRGVRQVVDAVRPTLGPRPGVVAVGRPLVGGAPELLDDAGLIARRIVELPDRNDDVGAMYVRGLLWRVHERVGDGVATAAVIFQSIYDQGLRYIAAGGDPVALRRHLTSAGRAIGDDLSGMARPVGGEAGLVQVARSVCHDPELAKLLGEIFSIIGVHGQIEIRSGQRRESERDYVEGMYWRSGVHSVQLIADQPGRRAELENCAVFITDLDVQEPRDLVPLLELARDAGRASLVLVAMRVSDRALGLLMANHDPAACRVIAVKTPGVGATERAEDMTDLAVLTGGRPVLQAAGQTLRDVRRDDMGFARRGWADQSHFGIVGGKGDPRLLRGHIVGLRAAHERADDPAARAKLRERLGKLRGGSATLRVGGASEPETAARKAVASRTADALRGVLMEGVVPGGGAALLACRPTLRRLLDESVDVDERAALGILIRAVEEPCRTILANAGVDAGAALARIELAGPGQGFDVLSGRVVDMAEAGILDGLAVARTATETAIGSAALALTVDVLVHPRRPDMTPIPT